VHDARSRRTADFDPPAATGAAPFGTSALEMPVEILHAFCFDRRMADLVNRLTTESFYPLAQQGIRVLLIFLAALIAVRIINRSVSKVRGQIVQMMSRHADASTVELEKRATTLGNLFRKTVSVLIWGLAIVTGLAQVGLNIGPILAGAGVVGLAVGFGAQNLVRDVVSGLFILLENQISVNDVATINGTSGLVEEINLRTTVLRAVDGVVHVFPNGAITSLSNMTRDYSYYVFDIRVAYKEDTDQVVEVVKEVADRMMREDQYGPLILAPLEVLGVDCFADSAVVIKARIKTLPIKQWEVGREMNRRIKKRFDGLGIEIPFPHRTLYVGEASKPFCIKWDEADRAQLKALIREVLEEHASRIGCAAPQS
jgi:small-conductance mechanosensitive channel